MTRKDSGKGDANGSDIAVSTHLGDKTATGTQDAPHLRHHLVLPANPVQHGVGNDGVESGSG